MKKALVLAVALSAAVFVSTLPSEAAIVSNGFHVNGFNINGFNINGFRINGFYLNGYYLNGISLSTIGLDFATISHQGLGK